MSTLVCASRIAESSALVGSSSLMDSLGSGAGPFLAKRDAPVRGAEEVRVLRGRGGGGCSGFTRNPKP